MKRLPDQSLIGRAALSAWGDLGAGGPVLPVSLEQPPYDPAPGNGQSAPMKAFDGLHPGNSELRPLR